MRNPRLPRSYDEASLWRQGMSSNMQVLVLLLDLGMERRAVGLRGHPGPRSKGRSTFACSQLRQLPGFRLAALCLPRM